VKPRSDNRARQERDYRVMRTVFLEENPRCARCTGRAEEIHHAAGRQGWRLLYAPWWLAMCAECHRWVTEHPVEAVRLGWSLTRLGGAS